MLGLYVSPGLRGSGLCIPDEINIVVWQLKRVPSFMAREPKSWNTTVSRPPQDKK